MYVTFCIMNDPQEQICTLSCAPLRTIFAVYLCHPSVQSSRLDSKCVKFENSDSRLSTV